MSPFLEGILGIAFTFLIIKWLWDGLVKAPQKKFESQIDFLKTRAKGILISF